MRHPVIIASALFLVLPLLGGGKGIAQTPSDKSLLWRIEGNGLTEVSYIYGTMHVQHKDVFDLADSVLPALVACRWFATEVNLDTMSRIYIQRMLGVDDEESGEEGVGVGGKEFIRGMFQTGRSSPTTDDESGYAAGDESNSSGGGQWSRFGDIVSRSRTPEEDGPVFLDAWLFQTAKRLGKKLLGVEDVLDHMSVLDDEEAADEEDTRDGARGNNRTLWRSMSIQRKMLEAYRKGDIKKIESLMRESLEPHRFHALLTRRNRIMVDAIAEYAAQAPTFVAVGAGHLGGEHGVIALLRDRGYKVTPVPATKSHQPSKVVIPTDPLPWKTLDDDGAALVVDLPLDPVAARLDTVNEDEPLVRVWMMADAGGGLLYMVYSVDVPSSYCNPFLGQLLPAFTSSWMRSLEGDSLTTTDISLKDMAGKEGIVKDEDVSYRLRVYMRGARLYVLAVAGDQRLIGGEDAERFFASFRTKPTLPHAWKRITLSEDSVTIDLPGDPIDAQEDARYMPNATVRNVASRDPNSGRTYSVQVIRYSPYYSTGPIDEFWKRIVSDWVGPTQTSTDSAIVVGGYNGRDVTAIDTLTHVVTRVRSIIAGRRLIEIWGVGGVGDEGAEGVDRFIGSLHVSGIDDGDIQAEHGQQIVADIASDENDRRRNARLEIPEYPWGRRDLPLLYSAIQRSYPWDDVGGDDDAELATSTPELLLRSLRGAWDSTTVPFLRRAYGRFADDSRLKGTIVDVLASIGTVESVSAMLELLRAESSPLPGFSIYSLSDSLSRVASLLPEIVRLGEVRKYRLSILQVIEHGLDSGYIAPAVFRTTGLAALCRSTIEERLNPTVDADDEKGGLSLREQWAGVAIRVLGWLDKSDENVRAIKELLPDSNSVLAMSATVALIRMTGSAPAEYVNRFAADSSLVIWFYTELQSTAPALFPPFWKKQAHFAMGGLIRWIIRDNGDEPSEIRYLAQREVDLKGGRGRVFLFKFRLSDRAWYVGIGGPQPITSTEISIDDSLAFSRYRALSHFSIDRHFKDLLDQ